MVGLHYNDKSNLRKSCCRSVGFSRRLRDCVTLTVLKVVRHAFEVTQRTTQTKMQSEISEIFAQYLDFLPSEAVENLSKQFLQRYASLYSSAPREQVPSDRYGELELFLFEGIKKVVRQDPRLDLRYPDEAIQNLVLLLIDRLEGAVASD